MTLIGYEGWLSVEESTALLHAIFPSWPELSPCVHVDIERWKLAHRADYPTERLGGAPGPLMPTVSVGPLLPLATTAA